MNFLELHEAEYKRAIERFPDSKYTEIFGSFCQHAFQFGQQLGGLAMRDKEMRKRNRSNLAVTCVQISVLVRRFYEKECEKEITPESYRVLFE